MELKPEDFLSEDADIQKPNPLSSYVKSPPVNRTWGEAASDTGAAILGGGAGLIGSVGDLYGGITGNVNNPVSETGKKYSEYFSEKKSNPLKALIQQRSEKVDAQDSWYGEAYEAAKETLTNPALAMDFAAGNAASLIPAGFVGRAATKVIPWAMKAAGLGALPAAKIGAIGTGAAVGTMAAQQGVDVSRSAYDSAMAKDDSVWDQNPEFLQELAANGGDREAAKSKMALSSARSTFLPAAAISVVANKLPGANYLERALVGGAARKTIGEGVKYAAPKAVLKSVFGGGGQEFIEEGGGQLAGNVAIQSKIDPNQDVLEGVGENAGMGFAGGVLLGAPAGLANAVRRPEQKTPQETTSQTPEDAPLQIGNVITQPTVSGQQEALDAARMADENAARIYADRDATDQERAAADALRKATAYRLSTFQNSPLQIGNVITQPTVSGQQEALDAARMADENAARIYADRDATDQERAAADALRKATAYRLSTFQNSPLQIEDKGFSEGISTDQQFDLARSDYESQRAAQENADKIYAERAAYDEEMARIFSGKAPEISGDIAALKQGVDKIISEEGRAGQSSPEMTALLNTPVGTVSENGQRAALTLGQVLDADAAASNYAENESVKTARKSPQSQAAIPAAAQPIQTTPTAPSIPIVGPLSALANSAISTPQAQSSSQQVSINAIPQAQDSSRPASIREMIVQRGQRQAEANQTQQNIPAPPSPRQQKAAPPIVRRDDTTGDLFAQKAENPAAKAVNVADSKAKDVEKKQSAESDTKALINRSRVAKELGKTDAFRRLIELSKTQESGGEVKISEVNSIAKEFTPNAKMSFKGDEVVVGIAKKIAKKIQEKFKGKVKENKGESSTLKIGSMPASAELITVKDGVVHIGGYPIQDFETGEEVTVPDGATNRDIADAVIASGQVTKGMKIFGAGKAAKNKGVFKSIKGRPEKITVDGVPRPTTNSNGAPIHPTREGVKNFWKWFGDSKVVDEQGRPLVVYHGTDKSFDSFSKEELGNSTGAEGSEQGFFFTARKDVAESYANYSALYGPVRREIERADFADAAGRLGEYESAMDNAEALEEDIKNERNRGQNIIPAYLKIQDVIEFDAKGEFFTTVSDDINKVLAEAKNKGIDGVIIRNIDDDAYLSDKVGDHFVAFNPEQIKSATGNQGSFDENSANILFSRKGNVENTEASKRLSPVRKNSLAWQKFKRQADLIDALSSDDVQYVRSNSRSSARFERGGEVLHTVGKDVSSVSKTKQEALSVMFDMANETLNVDAEKLRAASLKREISSEKNKEIKANLETLSSAMLDEKMLIETAHQNKKLSFKPLPEGSFLAKDTVSIYSSPSYGKKEGSAYRLVLVDGKPAYARESDHWGKFETRQDYETWVDHDWALEGLSKNDGERHAGYILLDDLKKLSGSSRIIPNLIPSNTLRKEERRADTSFDRVEKMSEGDAAIMSLLNSGKGTEEIISYIATSSTNPFFKNLARLLKLAEINPTVSFLQGGERSLLGKGSEGALAMYRTVDNSIALFRKAGSEAAFLHEMIHAATVYGLTEHGDASQEMSRIFDHLSKEGFLEGSYAGTDVFEFTAEAFSNPDFQEFLKTIPAPKNSAFKNAWEWFVNIVREMLGLKANYLNQNMLEKVVSVGVEVMREDADERPNGPASGKIRFKMSDTVKSFVEKNETLNKKEEKLVGDTRRYTDAQRKAYANVGRVVSSESFKERADATFKDGWLKLSQGIFDQFAPVERVNKLAYQLLRLSKGSAGAFEALIKHGTLGIDKDGTYTAKNEKGVIDALLKPLKGEGDDFFWWVAANRAEQLSKQDREHLFTPEDIAQIKSTNKGLLRFDFVLQNGEKAGGVTRNRAEAYNDSLQTFNKFNKNVLDIAEKSGLIDGESRAHWEQLFYVPFFREKDDGGFSGAGVKNGVIRQEGIKRLKGGKEKLNSDLMKNVMENWWHMIDASAKNRAAGSTLDALVENGMAEETSKTSGNNVVWKMGERTITIPKGREYTEGGVDKISDGTAQAVVHGKVHYEVSDPMMMTALSSLDYSGLNNPIMKALSTTKHWLTMGVTASPAFKVRNLIRDSLQAIAAAEISYNPIANVKQGFEATRRDSDEYVNMLASGAMIRFGSMLDGQGTDKLRNRLIKMGIEESTILDTKGKIRGMWDKTFAPAVEAYNELGNRGEEITRAALYQQMVKMKNEDGSPKYTHGEAALAARDLMDFSKQGSFASIRFLTQIVPFMNARLQGLYKLGYSAKENPARFATVLAATSLASIALMVAYSDDDDWKKREDWDRDNFWWFKIGGLSYRIPKPFEVGAMATMAERGVELFTNEEFTEKMFMERMKDILANNLSMNPIPQLVKPLIDVYANTDSFSGRPIESMGMEKLSPEYRFNSRTSLPARALSTAGNAAAGTVGASFFSPVQVDHMIRAYFGWLGTFAVGAADTMARPLTSEPTQPTSDYWNTISQGFVKDNDFASSRYVSHLYAQSKILEEAHATYRDLLTKGKVGEAKEFSEENKDKLQKFPMVATVKKRQSDINKAIRQVESSKTLTPDEKRLKINEYQKQKDKIARIIMEGGEK